MLLPKALLSDCVTPKFMQFLFCALLDLFVHQIRQPSRLRTMLFSVLQQARITLSHLHFLCIGFVCGLGPDLWWAFIPLASRLAIELQHARPRLAEVLKRSECLEDTIALLFSLSLPFGKKNSLFHMPFSVPQQDRATLFRLTFLELALYVVFILT